MKLISVLFLFGSLLIHHATGSAQSCDCLLSEVENNTVKPCQYTIGTIVTVHSEKEFYDAVNRANSTGGNMTILIADGTYSIASTARYPYITANNVVFRSLSGNRDAVVLTGQGMRAANGTEIGIYAVGDNITIADLTIKNLGNHGIAVTGDSVLVYNVKIQDTYEQMIKGNSTADGIKNGRVKCSLFEYTKGIGPQWYIGGLDIHKGIQWTVSDNVFKDISSPSRAEAEHAIHFWDASADNLVERNKIVNCDRGIGFGLGNSPNSGGIIKNNMITNDGRNAFDDVGISLESSPHSKVYHNSIFIDYPNAIEFRFASTSNVEITNNLANRSIRSRNGGTATLTTNLTNAQSSWFVNTTTGNLRLARDLSSVVNSGTALSNVTEDIDQVARPQGSGIDIGASEYIWTTGLNNPTPGSYEISVFPNPTSNSFTIQAEEGRIAQVIIYNTLYQQIAAFDGKTLGSTLTVDTRDWKNGMYICHITLGNRHYPMIARFAISK